MRLALLAIPAVRSALSLELGRAIEYHDSIPSTQDRARELSRAQTPALVVADEQIAGRGTRGRTWLAPKGTSLLASWTFRPAPEQPALFALLAGVAVARALERSGVRDPRLKWPNDVELDRKKVAGALAHGSTDGEAGSLVLGIGVNVHQRAEDFARDLSPRATSLAIVGYRIDRLALLAALSREIDRLTDTSERQAALAEWRTRATFLGQEVEVTRDGAPAVRGVARDIAEDGALVVGGERVLAGDVRLLR
jgi:BirA family transcriptional regulator, biotin operon repressor / biotin---[acetyl-CoA-carboxylase] ligase